VTPFVSIIIPCRNEERYIEQCLTSIINSTYPKESLEVLVVDGISEDNTATIVNNCISQYPFIHLFNNPNQTTPHALNLGIQHSKGEYIVLLSAHAHYPINYLEILVNEIIRLDCDCTGPVLQTKTFIQNNTSNAIVNVLSDRFGVGSRFRSGVETITEVDTVPFGCYRKEIFEKYDLFDERLIRNQDIELNKRIVRGGGKIYLLPDVQCTYYARETYIDLAKNNYQNGYWNILTAYYTGTLNSLSLRHFVPFGFVLALIIPILLSPFYPPIFYITAALAMVYLFLIGWRAWKIKKNTTWIHQLIAFIILHFSYGFGSIGGIIALIQKSKFKDT
jgi:glycosyltransferase involved in cell wall biosynthesis